MSAAANSRAELVEVLKNGIRTDHNGLGYPRDPGRFNLSGIIRDAFTNAGYYGWRSKLDDAGEYADVLRRHYRPKHRAPGAVDTWKSDVSADDAPTGGPWSGRHVLEAVAA